MSDVFPRGYQQLTGLSTAKPVVVPKGANYAMVRCTGGDVRWRDDGGVPTATVGYPLAAGDELRYDSRTGLAALQFVGQTADAEVSILYYGT